MTTLPPDLEVLVTELAESEQQRALMARALGALPYAAPPAEPSPDLRERVFARVLSPARGAQYWANNNFFANGESLDWAQLVPGIEIKILFQDSGAHARTV